MGVFLQFFLLGEVRPALWPRVCALCLFVFVYGSAFFYLHTQTSLVPMMQWGLWGYSVGAFPWALWLPRLWGKGDARTVGSGNLGTSNVYRLAGLTCAACVMAADVGKGALAVLMVPPPFQWWAGFMSVMGHIFSFYTGFKGGKGAACAAGVMMVLCPVASMSALVTWFVMVRLTSYASLASLAAMCMGLCTGVWWFFAHSTASVITPLASSGGFALFISLLLWAHRENLVRLWHGKEQTWEKARPSEKLSRKD